jgi:hypothetical protein
MQSWRAMLANLTEEGLSGTSRVDAECKHDVPCDVHVCLTNRGRLGGTSRVDAKYGKRVETGEGSFICLRE